MAQCARVVFLAYIRLRRTAAVESFLVIIPLPRDIGFELGQLARGKALGTAEGPPLRKSWGSEMYKSRE